MNCLYLQNDYDARKKFKILALLDKDVATIDWNFHISLLTFLDISVHLI